MEENEINSKLEKDEVEENNDVMICDGKDCGKEIKGKVKQFMIDNPDAFEGVNLCFPCQQKFKKERAKENKDIKRYGEIKEEKFKELKSLPQIRDLVENDIVEIFGDTGVGKSRLVHQFAKDIIRNKEKVLYIDTERNLGKDERLMIKDYYVYTPQLTGLKKIVESLSNDLDFVIIDSLGMPVLSKFARFSMKERGEALLSLIAILGDLKEWTYASGATAIIVNQPVSEMAMMKDAKPFGDKSSFLCKEVWKLEFERKEEHYTQSNLRTFRSRVMPYKKRVATVKIDDDGVNIDWEI